MGIAFIFPAMMIILLVSFTVTYLILIPLEKKKTKEEIRLAENILKGPEKDPLSDE